jgi:hypothetical protein
MDGACGTYGRQEMCIQCLVGGGGWGLREWVHLEGLKVDGRKLLKWIFKKWDACIGWIVLAQDRYRWPAVVNVDGGFRKMLGIWLDENCSFPGRTLLHGVSQSISQSWNVAMAADSSREVPAHTLIGRWGTGVSFPHKMAETFENSEIFNYEIVRRAVGTFQ